MEPLTISIILVLITLSLYHGIHIEFYNFFYLNSGFQGPKSVMERLRVARDLFDQKDFYERYWTPRSEIIKVFISPFTPSMYCVSDAALARNILQDSTMFARPERPSQIMKGIVDYALFILPTDGPYWKKHRKLLQPGFGPTHLRHTGSVTVKVMDKLSGLWNNRLKTSTDTITVNMKNVLGCIAMDVIGMVAFGKDLKMVDQLATNDDPRWQALETITSGSMVARFLLPRFLWSLFSVSSNSPKIKAAKDELDNMLKKLAAERREAIKEGRIGQEKWEMDVLQRLLLSSTESNVTDEEIFGELLGFFLAGHETTANTLTFAILELCKNPEIQQKLYESVKDIELSKGTDCLPLIDASAVKYLDNFLKEVQRLHSIVPKVPRTCNDNVDLQGHFVPRGALIHVYLKGIHLNPKYHPEPLKFNPDRFDSEIKPGTFLPFGDGPHNCIGFKMATIEAKVALVRLVQQYKFKLVKDQSLRVYSAITQSLRDGLFCQISRR